MSDAPKIAGAPTNAPPPEPAAAPALPPVAVAAAPHTITPPAPVAAPVVQATAPPVAPPVAAKPAPTATGDDGVDGLRAELAAELEKARAAREALEAVSQAQSDKARVEYLRKMGANDALSDQHLLTLSPSADPSTSDGAEALQGWQASNPALFTRAPEGQTIATDPIETWKSSPFGTFGPEFHRAQMRATFGGE